MLKTFFTDLIRKLPTDHVSIRIVLKLLSPLGI